MSYFIRIYDMLLNDNDIPKYVKQDVLLRVQDWYEAGNSLDHDYIVRQYQYLMRVKESIN